MSVTDVKLFSSTHRGTMLPDRDMAVLIQRIRPRPNAAQCTIEEIVTPKPSHKSPNASKPARVPTRVGAPPSSIPRLAVRSPTPRASPGSARSLPRGRSPQKSLRRSPRQSPGSPPSPPSPSHSPARSPPRSPPRSPYHSPQRSPQRSHHRSPQPNPVPRSASQTAPTAPQSNPTGPVDWRKVFIDADFRPEDFADIDVEKENATPLTRREKQEVLFQLIKTYPEESQGQWSMKVPLVELKYEWSRREHYKQEQAQVDAMKVGLKVILHAIEAINQKIKSPIHLKGWARSATHDMSKYERPLRGLYYMYLKKRQMSPMVELGWIILTSALMWHLQSGSSRTPSELDDVHDVPAPEPKKSNGIDLGSLASLARMFV